MELVLVAVPSILSAVALGILGWFGTRFNRFLNEHRLLLETERNDIKAQIVDRYETAKMRGYITPMELETMNRLYDSYEKLKGNSYISTIVSDANNNIPKMGISISNLVAMSNNPTDPNNTAQLQQVVPVPQGQPQYYCPPSQMVQPGAVVDPNQSVPTVPGPVSGV